MLFVDYGNRESKLFWLLKLKNLLNLDKLKKTACAKRYKCVKGDLVLSLPRKIHVLRFYLLLTDKTV